MGYLNQSLSVVIDTHLPWPLKATKIYALVRHVNKRPWRLFVHKDLSPSHSTPACSSEAALFAALFQALKHCAADQRDGILQTLEIRLDTAYDDLDEKAALLLTPNRMSVEDRVYGLWLL